MPDLSFEIKYGRNDGLIIAGTDEAGRGPLAGPVVAAAVIIPTEIPAELMHAINDSKKLSEKKREELFPLITRHCFYAIAQASAQEIDKINILQASLLAMRRAVEMLHIKNSMVLNAPPSPPHGGSIFDGNAPPSTSNLKPATQQWMAGRARHEAESICPYYKVMVEGKIHTVLIDGNKSPNIPDMKNIPIIKGDGKSLSIAAASILAKVTRDRMMKELHEAHPHYGWAQNMGYPTAAHLAALQKYGITQHHRKSFAPVRLCDSFAT